GGCRTSVRDGAIRAGARADLAENHERGGAVMPALADVRALRFLAHRVQLQLAHEALEACVIRRPRRAHLQPLGFRRPGCRHERAQVAHLADYIGRRPALREAAKRAGISSELAGPAGLNHRAIQFKAPSMANATSFGSPG